MFNRIKRAGRSTARFAKLVWRDSEVVAVIILTITSVSTGYSSYLGIKIGQPSLAWFDAEMSGVLLGFAIFAAIHIFRRQAERDQFREWATGCLQKLTNEANAALMEEAIKNQGGANADQRIH